jgi:hypothetical protein
MKGIQYAIKAVGSQPFFLSTLLSGLVIFVIFSDTVMTDSNVRFQAATKYLSWGTAFLSAILTAYSFRPEDNAHMEIQASLPTPFYKIVGEAILVGNLLIVLPIIGASILIANLTSQTSAIAISHGLLMIIANALFFSSVATLGTSLGRRSVIGALGSLTLVVIFSLLPLPEVVHPFLQNAGSTSYGNSVVALAVYIFMGTIIFVASLAVLKDVDYIFTGRRPGIVLLKKKTTKSTSYQSHRVADSWLQRILSISKHTFLGELAYEVFQWMISGWLPIMIGAITITFGFLVFVSIDVPYNFATNFPRSIIMFSLLLLPPILCDSIPSDRRNHRTSMIVSCISPRAYLSIKVVSAWIAVLVTVTISAMPFYMLLGIYALSGLPQYLMASMAVFLLAVVPLLVYISSLSVLLGTFANQRPAFAIGGVISVVAVIAYALTSNTIVGNLFFPSGTMAIETIADWLGKQVATQASYLNPTKTIVPWYLLFVPLAMAMGQIALVWQLVLHSFEQGDK